VDQSTIESIPFQPASCFRIPSRVERNKSATTQYPRLAHFPEFSTTAPDRALIRLLDGRGMPWSAFETRFLGRFTEESWQAAPAGPDRGYNRRNPLPCHGFNT